MSTVFDLKEGILAGFGRLSPGEEAELRALGILGGGRALGIGPSSILDEERTGIEKTAIVAPSVLNEAYDYGSAFSRGLRVEMGTHRLLFISGTASVDEIGDTVYTGDFRAQCWRTYRNITELLSSEGATWHDVVKLTCYLRDIERDYEEFNRVRNTFFKWLRLDPLPASVGIQARLCRENLLIEIEGLAILKND